MSCSDSGPAQNREKAWRSFREISSTFRDRARLIPLTHRLQPKPILVLDRLPLVLLLLHHPPLVLPMTILSDDEPPSRRVRLRRGDVERGVLCRAKGERRGVEGEAGGGEGDGRHGAGKEGSKMAGWATRGEDRVQGSGSLCTILLYPSCSSCQWDEAVNTESRVERVVSHLHRKCSYDVALRAVSYHTAPPFPPRPHLVALLLTFWRETAQGSPEHSSTEEADSNAAVTSPVQALAANRAFPTLPVSGPLHLALLLPRRDARHTERRSAKRLRQRRASRGHSSDGPDLPV